MADVITRFKLETTQYDSALRDASKGLAAYSKQAELAGKDFDKFTKGGVEAARALGSISTSATNTKDKVKELVSAYNDAARAYNNLTEEQKKSDFGKAMAQSLQQLQGRIKDAKAEMNDTGGVLSQLRERFTINIDALKLFSVGLQAAQGALSVAKDAFFASEATVDEWGRVTASAQSVYEGFLTAINTGDISGYLNRIDEIVQAARKAYDELDRLGTMKTIQAPQTERQNAENTRLRTMLMTGRYIAPAAGSGQRASMAEGTLLTPAQLKRIEQQLQGGMQTIVKLTGNELTQTGRAIDAYYDKLAKQNGMTMAEFKKGVSSMSEFDKRIAGAKRYAEYERAHTTYDERTGIAHRDKTINPDEIYKAWSVFRVDKQGQNSYNELVGLIRQQQQQTGQLYSTIGQAYRTINRAEGTTVRNIMNGGSGGGGRGGSGGGKTTPEYIPLEGSIDAQTMKVQELQRAWRAAADDDSRRRIKEEIDEQQYALDLITGKIKQRPKMEAVNVGVGIAPSSATDPFSNIKDNLPAVISPLQQLEDHLKELIELQAEFGGMSESAWQIYQKEIENTKGQIDNFKNGGDDVTKGGKDIAKSWRTAASAISTVGSAMSGLKNPAIDIMTVIGQSIATIALSYAENLAGDKTTKGNIWAFIAAAAAATVSMATTIASIHSATGYAQGGIVKGNSYSGDNVPALVDGSQMVGLNAGEVVLTAAMTNNLANGIQNRGFGNLNIVGVLEGEKIKLVLNRHLKRTGQGELVTWR